jgi:hypothetical protein
MTFNDGRYREIVINPQGRVDSATAHDYIYGSAIVPVFGEMPLISPPTNTPEMPLQFGDGGVRHQTPVTSYFQRCDPAADAATPPRCQPLTGNDTPRHPRTQQLFVVVTSPFSRRNDVRPVFAAKGVDPRTGQVTDGRQILVRMFDLFLDTMYRDDLDDMLLFNDLLRWQSQSAGSNPLTPFPIASFNRASSPDAATLPYDIAIIAPQREDSDPMTIFKVEPETMRRQLYCGCVAADDIMQTQFGLATLADRCAVRFPAMTPIDGVNDWPPGICGNSGLQP